MKQPVLFNQPQIVLTNQRAPIIEGGAIFSPDHTHRYVLWRMWDLEKPAIMFIGLNPSRADATYNDPTITRCKNFAEDWGFGRMHFVNLYSFVTPYVDKVPLQKHTQIWYPLRDKLPVAVGPEYMQHVMPCMRDADRIVCCWGSWAFTAERGREVLALIKDPWCFGINKNGAPKHPLYLSSQTKLIPYAKDKS